MYVIQWEGNGPRTFTREDAEALFDTWKSRGWTLTGSLEDNNLMVANDLGYCATIRRK